MILLQDLIHYSYFVMSAAIALLLVTRLFGRRTRRSLAYDLVCAYHHPVCAAGAAHQVR